MDVRGLRRVVADPDRPGSWSARARVRRWVVFCQTFPEVGSMRVLDLGGTAEFWRAAPVTPAHVTCVNMGQMPLSDEPRLTVVRGDACASHGDGWDLVFSNSVIEHVGGHDRRKMFADVVHRSAPRHWIQTPYRYFPIEPHWVFPGFQFLPQAVAMAVSRRWPLGRRSTAASAWEDVSTVELLTVGDMRGYFPGSRIWREHVGGLTKSLVAVRS